MVWVYKENNSCASTVAMIDELYDWITRTEAGPTFPAGSPFTAGIKGDVLASFSVRGTGGQGSNSSVGRYATPNSSTLGSSRSRTYRFGRGGVDYWFLLDTASQGGSPDLPNLGLLCWITTDTGKTSAQLQALVDAAVATPSSPTTPLPSACYPTHGATKYRFFTDGNVVHVAFKRSHPTASSWQHFSFGKIEKPAGASWVGGEYFSGCDIGDVGSTWDFTNWLNATYMPSTVLSNIYTAITPYDRSPNNSSPFKHGNMRVAGAYDAGSTPKAVNYCAIGQECLEGAQPSTAAYGGSIHVLGAPSVMRVGGAVGRVNTKSTNLLGCTPNTWNGRSPGVGVDLLYFDKSVTGRLQYLGSIPGIRYVMMDNITEDTALNQDWVVFPLHNVTTATETYSDHGHAGSGRVGVAYKLP